MDALKEELNKNKVQLIYSHESWENLPPLNADRWYLGEVIKNLIENAFKFNPKQEKQVILNTHLENKIFRFEVTDNGPGIPPEEQRKLFQKFYQIEESFTGQVEGLGLGLAFVKNVIQAHGGGVGVISSVGQGSTFYFTLPIKK